MEKQTIVLFGSTGHLSKKKILPALAKIPQIEIIAIGRRDIKTKEYMELMNIDKNMNGKIEYVKTDFKDAGLAKHILDKKTNNIIFYLATPSDLFVPIIQFLHKSKLTNPNFKYAFEKPFGSSLESAQEIYKTISNMIGKDSMFFVDHYLGKEMVHILPQVKTLPKLATIWKEECVERADINLLENFGVEGRGEFYDKEGAIRDVVQNHILQIISLLLSVKQEEKAQIISELEVPTQKEIVVGQYEGYLKEPDVNKNSKTETYVSFKTQWNDVNINVKTGKFLDRKASEVLIYSKNNFIKVHIQPDEGIFLNNSKIFTPKKEMSDYENIFISLIKKDKSRFVTWPEIEASWKFTDALIKTAKKNKLIAYSKNSAGPDIK